MTDAAFLAGSSVSALHRRVGHHTTAAARARLRRRYRSEHIFKWFGIAGIAIALMGRNHPVGIFFASLLFGALYQGGAELDFEFQSITREIVLLIQGMIVLFSGALAYMFSAPLARLLARLTVRPKPAAGEA